MNTAEAIRARLTETFHPSVLELVDESAHHAGHAHNTGGGHYHLTITSEAFKGKSLIESHRMIYKCLEDLMHDLIHALSITVRE